MWNRLKETATKPHIMLVVALIQAVVLFILAILVAISVIQKSNERQADLEAQRVIDKRNEEQAAKAIRQVVLGNRTASVELFGVLKCILLIPPDLRTKHNVNQCGHLKVEEVGIIKKDDNNRTGGGGSGDKVSQSDGGKPKGGGNNNGGNNEGPNPKPTKTPKPRPSPTEEDCVVVVLGQCVPPGLGGDRWLLGLFFRIAALPFLILPLG